MTDYYYSIPNGKICGAALQIQNTASIDVTGIYSDAGLFLEYDADAAGYPLITAGSAELITIPANSTVNIAREFPVPIQAFTFGRLRLDSTSIPSTCIITPVLLVDGENIG